MRKFDSKALTAWDNLLGWITDRMYGKSISEDGHPYLERFPLYESDKFGVFLHRFVDSDPASVNRGILHDHPYAWALSITLSGFYDELRFVRGGVEKSKRTRIKWIFGHTFHRVVMGGECKKPCYTMFIHGPKVKPWGFMANIKMTKMGNIVSYVHNLVTGHESFMENQQRGKEFKVRII